MARPLLPSVGRLLRELEGSDPESMVKLNKFLIKSDIKITPECKRNYIYPLLHNYHDSHVAEWHAAAMENLFPSLFPLFIPAFPY